MTALFPRVNAVESSELLHKSAKLTFKRKIRFYRCQESFPLHNRYRGVYRLQLADSKNHPYPFKAAPSIRATLKGIRLHLMEEKSGITTVTLLWENVTSKVYKGFNNVGNTQMPSARGVNTRRRIKRATSEFARVHIAYLWNIFIHVNTELNDTVVVLDIFDCVRDARFYSFRKLFLFSCSLL